ncbi:MAG: flagellar motor stator protein MotA [Armatimonadetes bacterium]|nr:flagellar motor stator protein MotA [Armatimonadota bacterium]
MFVLIGLCIVFGSILFGYTASGGKIAAIMQFKEFIIIGGCAFGSTIVSSGLKGGIGMLMAPLILLKGNPYTKDKYLELLRAMYELFIIGRKGGLIAMEKHIEEPRESEIFKKFPFFMSQHHALSLFADTMKIVVMGGVSVFDLGEMMDMDLEVQHEESLKLYGILTTVADSMPGFGIVAAVLGVVITMAAIGGPPEVIGEKVGAALVGTFIGILLAYGVYAPMAKAVEAIAKAESAYMACIKCAIVAFARGDSPLICVEFSRRNIEPGVRPGFAELEDNCKGRNKPEAQQAEAA